MKIRVFSEIRKPLVFRYKKICPTCGDPFLTHLDSFKFCSDTCVGKIPLHIEKVSSFKMKSKILLSIKNVKCRICGVRNKQIKVSTLGTRSWLVTHHIDWDRKHNDWGNLVVLCQSCHITTHLLMKKHGLTSNPTSGGSNATR